MAADLTLKLSPEPTAPGLARQAAQQHFGDQLSRQRLNDLVLVISELVGNAVVHGRGDVVLRLQLDGETLRGEVIDHGAGFEHEIRARGPDDIGGRGLMLVESMTSHWGIHEGTTHVWFEMAAGQHHDSSTERLEPRLGEAERPDALD
jgi:anti-sigma regulatory factor (Ser/Thr protein kinase)